MIERAPPAERFAERPRRRERDDERAEHRRAESPAPKATPANSPGEGHERKRRMRRIVDRLMVDEQRRGGGDDDRDHDHLRRDGADRRIEPREVEIGRLQTFIDGRRLLIKDHPRHDDRADVAGDEQQIVSIAERLRAEDARRAGSSERRVRGERRGDEEQLEEAKRRARSIRRACSGRRTRRRSAASRPPITSGRGGKPKISAAPAMPMNSVTSAARFVTSIVPSETHAQPSP